MHLYIFHKYIDWLEKEYKRKVLNYQFRSKKISWRGSSCYAQFENGLELKNDKKLCGFMNLYYSNCITRESCYICPYATENRVADITISDYWGVENLDKSFEDNLGVSMVLVNTEKGKELFDRVKGEKISGDISVAKQPHLKKPVNRPPSRESFWAEYESKGIKPILAKYGAVKDSFKAKLYKIKIRILGK